MVSLHEEHFASDAILSPLYANLNNCLVRNTGHKKPHPFGGWGGGGGKVGGTLTLLIFWLCRNKEFSHFEEEKLNLGFVPPSSLPSLLCFTVLPPTPSAKDPASDFAFRGWSHGARRHGKNYKLRWQDFPDDRGWTSVTKLMSHSNQKSWMLIPNWASASWVTMNKSFNLTVCFLSYKRE